jgi:lipoprotein NlpD
MPVSVMKILLFTFMLLLTACRSETAYRAPVADIGQASVSSPRTTVTLSEGPRHRVNVGETLYAIAWMYDLNYQALAQANNIASPYVIFPGQVLRLPHRRPGLPMHQPLPRIPR